MKFQHPSVRGSKATGGIKKCDTRAKSIIITILVSVLLMHCFLWIKI